TCPRTRSPWRRARGWRHESAAASSTHRTTTCSPIATRPRTRSSARRATAGTRSPTGRSPGHQARGHHGARTTCCTGPAATGGGSGPGRTVTSAGPRGGTVGTPPPTPRRSPPAAGPRPVKAGGVLSEADGQRGPVLLPPRLADGCPTAVLGPAGQANAAQVVADGLADAAALARGRIVLTCRGRLLADAVAQKLTEP